MYDGQRTNSFYFEKEEQKMSPIVINLNVYVTMVYIY